LPERLSASIAPEVELAGRLIAGRQPLVVAENAPIVGQSAGPLLFVGGGRRAGQGRQARNLQLRQTR
jgi:hypothetical protein